MMTYSYQKIWSYRRDKKRYELVNYGDAMSNIYPFPSPDTLPPEIKAIFERKLMQCKATPPKKRDPDKIAKIEDRFSNYFKEQLAREKNKKNEI